MSRRLGGVKKHRFLGGVRVGITGRASSKLLGRSVLGDGLGAFRHSVLRQFAGKDEADGGLDLAGREGALLVVAAQLAGFGSALLEDVVDERVHDGHGALGDASVGVNLLQHLVDVGGVGLRALGLAGARRLAAGLAFAAALSFSSFCGHDCLVTSSIES